MGLRGTSEPQESKIWKDLWDENTAGSDQAIRTWTNEILLQCKNILKTTNSWNTKKQIGKSITDIAKAQGKSIVNYMDEIVPLLTAELIGRTFDGKEALLEVIGVLI
jgi:proteasome component ECM29